MSPLSVTGGPRTTSAPASTSSAKVFSTWKRRSRRQPVGWLGQQLHGAVEAPAGGHLVDAEPHGVLEQRAPVGLGEVVEDAHQDGVRGVRRFGHVFSLNGRMRAQRPRTTTLALAPRPTVWASATWAPSDLDCARLAAQLVDER